VHDRDDGTEHVGIGFGQYAMSQIKDVTGAAARETEYLASGLDAFFDAVEATVRVEVPLHWLVPDATSSFVDANMPINAYDAATSAGHECK
jgi:hypothetical protein